MTSREEYLLYKVTKEDLKGYVSCIICDAPQTKEHYINNLCKTLSQIVICSDNANITEELKDYIKNIQNNFQFETYKKFGILDILSKEFFNYIVDHIEDIEKIIYNGN
jgi:hypothetical protein